MSRQAALLYVVAMVVLIVAVDLAFMRHHFWPRLVVNAAIVAVFAAVYVLFLRKS